MLHFFESCPCDEYIRAILSPNSWGGAIELTILAAHYGTEIASIDIETGRIDTFGPSDDGTSKSHVLLIYSGPRQFQAGERVRVHVDDKAAFVV